MGQKGTYDLHQRLQDEGMTLDGIDDAGNALVRSPDGQAGTYDVGKLLKDDGFDPKDVTVLYNTPATPVQSSPLDLAERAALGANVAERGKGYLSRNFDRVAQTDSGLVVQQDGVWYAVDPKGLGSGDAWQKTRELVADLSEGLADQLPSMAVGALTRTPAAALAAAPLVAAGAPGLAVGAAALTGAVASGALAGYVGSKVKTSLGRAIGTYEATPEEQAQDEATEMIVNAAGEVMAPGVAMTATALLRGMRRLGRWATDGSKSILAEVLGATTKAGAPLTRRLMDEPEPVVDAMRSALKAGAGDRNAAIDAAKRSAIEATRQLVEEAPKALTKEYGRLTMELAEKAGDRSIRENFGTVAKEIYKEWEELGVGRVAESMRRIAGDASGLVSTPTVMTRSARLVPISDAERAVLPKAVNPTQEGHAAIQKLFEMVQGFRKLGRQEGKQAVEGLVNLQQRVNQLLEGEFAKADPAYKRVLTHTVNAVRRRVGEAFERVGLEKEYAARAGLYERFGQAVSLARQTVDREGYEGLLNKLTKDAGKDVTVRSLVGSGRAARDVAQRTGSLVELLGARGEKLYGDMMNNQAAAAFIPRFKLGLYSLAAGASTAAGITKGMLTPALGAPVLAQFSPTLVAKEALLAGKAARLVKRPLEAADAALLRYGRDFLTKMTHPQLKQFLGREDLVAQFARSMAVAHAGKERMRQGAIRRMEEGRQAEPGDLGMADDQMERVGRMMQDGPIPEDLPDAPGRPVVLGGRKARIKR